MKKEKKQIGIIGGGPAGLFMYKQLTESGESNIAITIFEKKEQLGAGMPYSQEGACNEHITNVSDNEIPEMVTSIKEWIRTCPPATLLPFDMKPELFNDYKVVPRLLFGEYLNSQFDLLHKLGKKAGIPTTIYCNTVVIDIADNPELKEVEVKTEKEKPFYFDTIIICTGHY